MKKIFILLLTSILLIMLVSCSSNDSNNKEITYTGESENWKATIVNKISKYSNNVLRIEYKGNLDDLKNVHQIDYSFQYGQAEIKRSETRPNGLPTDKSIVYKDTGKINVDSINKQTKIPFKIKWDNRSEECELEFK
ncbi:hypothetical protein [Rummeliibacillus suwonensis]|uniref:hypothetical protein n=1 Tax=Rummeliibacillus suwonensis TaxID=1306154 RepID=UPI001AAFB99C|nr:hypothetical protein [Rummeliibacillus suwonensis]MBO2537644.1 hypothetical protein [Rummeliibacillus suwonensis]